MYQVINQRRLITYAIFSRAPGIEALRVPCSSNVHFIDLSSTYYALIAKLNLLAIINRTREVDSSRRARRGVTLLEWISSCRAMQALSYCSAGISVNAGGGEALTCSGAHASKVGRQSCLLPHSLQVPTLYCLRIRSMVSTYRNL